MIGVHALILVAQGRFNSGVHKPPGVTRAIPLRNCLLSGSINLGVPNLEETPLNTMYCLFVSWCGYTRSKPWSLMVKPCQALTFWEKIIPSNSPRAYSLFFIVGTYGAIQIPVVGMQPLRSLDTWFTLVHQGWPWSMPWNAMDGFGELDDVPVKYCKTTRVTEIMRILLLQLFLKSDLFRTLVHISGS